MIDHISLRVSDFQSSLTFYKAALEPLGYTLVFSNDKEQYAGFAGPDRERIWIGHREGASHGLCAYRGVGEGSCDGAQVL